MHLHVHSIERHIDEIQVFLDLLKFQFDVLCFSESKIVEGFNPKTSILLEGYQEPLGMPKKATKGGVLIYVKNGITFVPRDDLNIQKGNNWNLALLKFKTAITQNQSLVLHPIMDQN